jgi:Kef-type K+ transport system membrane component KefB/Trk K+ transport system NAD-binding subunit
MEDESFYQLLLISALAVLVPVVAARTPAQVLPAVVGEIIAGAVIGSSGLKLIDPTPILEFLAKFGFAYLMFLSGLELDPNVLRASGDTPRRGPGAFVASSLGSATFMLAGTLAIVFACVAVLEVGGLAPDLWLTTLILSTTSVGVVVPTLKSMGLTARPYGQTLLVAAFLADFVTLILIGAFAVLHREGPNAELALIFVLPLAFLLVYRMGSTLGSYRIVSRTVEELAHATAQLQVRGALALMLAFVVLAETIGSELILGSFIAGVVVALFSPEEGTSLRLKLDAIGYGFFIPIFFVNVGVDLDLGALSGSAKDLGLLPVFLAIGYVSKIVPALILRNRFSLRETLAGGVLLSSRLSLIIAASIIGLELGVITPGVNSAFVLVAVVTSSLSPVVFLRVMRSPEGEAGRVIIVGAGETGRSLAARLAASGSRPVLIEVDEDAASEARRDGFQVVQGRADKISVLREAGADSAEALVAVTPDDRYNLTVCRRAQTRFGISQLASRLNEPDQREAFVRVGVRPVLVALSTAAALENAVLRPSLFQVLVDRPRDYEVLEVNLRNPALIGKRLREVRLPGHCLILLIRREGELVAPSGATVLKRWDHVTLAGDRESVHETARLMRSRPSWQRRAKASRKKARQSERGVER